MSTRSRVTSRAQDPPRKSSISSTSSSSRVRSTTIREKSSPYGSVTRRSNGNQNRSPSTTSKRVNSKKKSVNYQRNDTSESHLSDDEQLNVVVGQSDDDENSRNASNITSQSTSTHTTLTANFQQNLSLNDNSNTMLTTANASHPKQNHIASNYGVNNLFDQIPNGLFRCKLCQQELKSKRFSTTNLRKHIGLVHKRPEFLYPSQQKSYASKSSTVTLQRKKELNSAVISCIIKDSRAFNDFRKGGMQQFLSVAVPGYVAPHRTTIRAHISRRYAHHRDLLRLVLAKVPAIALTSDVWKNSSGTHFISVTAHFYDAKYKLISLTIGFRQLIGNHIAKRLRKYILHEITSLKIQDKICSITTDNASNIVCATEDVPEFGTRISCLGHVFNLIVQDGVPLWEKSGKNSVDAAIADEDDVQNSSADEDEDEDEDEETEDSTDGELGDDKRTLDDSFDDEVETESDNDTPSMDDTLTYVRSLVNRTRRFIKFARRCYHIRDYLKEEAEKQKLEGHGLILDCIVRWNSSFHMLNRFVNYQDLINQITINPRLISSSLQRHTINRLKQFIYHPDAWEHLVAIRNVLEMFEEACRLISGKRYQTLSIGCLVLMGLEHHLSRPVTPGPQAAIESVLKQNLYEAYCFHIDDKITSEQRYAMMIACFLDPQTYFIMSDSNKDEAQKQIIAEARKRNLLQQTVAHSHDQSNGNGSSSTKNPSSSNNNQLNDFLAGCGFNLTTSNFVHVSSKKSIKEEIAYFINKVKPSISFEDFWINHETELPCLSMLVRSFNVRPISSVASESLFSIAAYVNRKQRCSLSPDTLKYSMVLRDADVLTSLL